MKHTWIRSIAPLVWVAALLTACSARPGSGINGPTLYETDLGTTCTEYFPDPATLAPNEVGVPIPTDFTAVAATRCRFISRVVEGEGVYQYRLEERTEDDLADLITQLRQPPPPQSRECNVENVAIPLVITMIDAAGHAIVPAVPSVGCGFAVPAVLGAVQALSWRPIREVKVVLVHGEVNSRTNCPPDHQPVIELDAPGQRGDAPSLAGVYPVPPTELQVCHYLLGPAQAGHAGDPDVQPGWLNGATILTGAPLTEFLAGVRAARPVSGPCAGRPGPFAVVSNVGGAGPKLIVEVARCHRLDDGLGHVYQLEPSASAP